MILADITELRIVSVLDRGEPNKECIAVVANNTLDVGRYGIMLGHFIKETGAALPFSDNLFWFGDAVINANDWLFIYTGSGTAKMTRTVDDLNDVYSLYWGKPHTVFADSIIVPMLVRLDAVQVVAPPVNQMQLPARRKD